jgi:uncharacterized protein (TIGR03435 family)
LAELVQVAYGPELQLYRFQVTGGPDWIDSARFDITATPSPGAGPATIDQAKSMVKALLADRFKLVVREETKDAPIYALVLASRDGQLGPKLRRASFTCPQPGAAAPPPADAEKLKECVYRIGYGTLTARGITIRQLTMSMANFYGVGRLVVDRTGLTGGFDMDMEWAPLVQFRQPGNLDPPPDAADRQVNSGPTIFVALREQLGLVLESQRGPVPSIVIERVERPTPD